MKENAGRSSQAAGRLGFRCGVPPRQTQTDNDASGNPQRVAGRLTGRPLRHRNQAMKNYAAICCGRRGRPGRRSAARFGFKPHSGIMAGFYERRPFLGFRCGVPPRQTQTDNDASGNPQRVAVRLDRTSPTASQPGDTWKRCLLATKKSRPTALCVGDAQRASRL